MRLVILLVPAVLLGGCALTADERKAILDEAADIAAFKAYEKAKSAGVDEESAKKVGEVARDEARKLVEKALPRAEAEKRSKFGGALASLLLGLLQLAGAAVRRGGVA